MKGFLPASFELCFYPQLAVLVIRGKYQHLPGVRISRLTWSQNHL
jgi:hypothetical protein